MAVYTRRGDAGQTSLLSGERVAKDELQVQSYGAADELQAQLGMVIALARSERVRALLRDVQEDVVAICAQLASSPSAYWRLGRLVGRADAAKLERAIDALSVAYPLPHRFVRPGASPDSAAAHVARTVCRRCERLIVTLNRDVGGLSELLVYMNRLSDFLFVVAWSLEVDARLDEVVATALGQDGAGTAGRSTNGTGPVRSGTPPVEGAR